MADKLLLIPGTCGNKLRINDEDLGWPVELPLKALLATKINLLFGFDLELIDPQTIVDQLSMEYSDDTDETKAIKTTLVPDAEIKPGSVLMPAYNQFDDFETFPYDWRADIRENGRVLLQLLEDNKPPGGRWKIVSHSQGGLLVVVASKLFGRKSNDNPDAFSSLVSKIAFVGVPFHGTINVAEYLIKGENLTKPFKEHFKKIVRTWPAIYQMLPTWPECVHRMVDGHLEPVTTYNLMYEKPWERYDLNKNLLARAMATRGEFLRSPSAYMNKIDIRIFMSAAYETANHMIMDNDGDMVKGAVGEEGDTLVPEVMTRSRSGQYTRECMFTLGSLMQPGGTMKHSLLCTDPAVATGVEKFFQGE